MVKICIFGSRKVNGKVFKDYEFVKENVKKVLSENKILIKNIDEFVSGNAMGVDVLGERLANEMKKPVKQFKPTWYKKDEKDGKFYLNMNAGFERNEIMADYTDIGIAFSANTNGTKHMIETLAKKEKKCYIIYMNNKE
jgi:hypothetical protein